MNGIGDKTLGNGVFLKVFVMFNKTLTFPEHFPNILSVLSHHQEEKQTRNTKETM